MATAKKGGAKKKAAAKKAALRRAQRRDSKSPLRKTGVLCVRTRGWATIPFFFLVRNWILAWVEGDQYLMPALQV